MISRSEFVGGPAEESRPDPEPDIIVGESPAMRALRETVRKIGQSSARAVLITGESGTGKGLVARAIHAASERSARPFVPITCSAIPEHLLESELFGHEAGAFTDGKKRKVGLLESADGGTVFLDEIGDMAPLLQAKLLGILEERKLRRIGGLTEVPVDIRVISATHRDLRALVDQGEFREDLLHRLCVVPVRVPSLRERPDDIPLLAAHFVSQLCGEIGAAKRIEPRVLELLEARDWPGNVRELRNALERAVVFSTSPVLKPDDFEWRMDSLRPTVTLPAGGLDIETVIDDLVRAAMERTQSNQSAAARLLGMTRNQIRYRLEKMGVLPASGHRPPPDGEPGRPRPRPALGVRRLSDAVERSGAVPTVSLNPPSPLNGRCQCGA